MMDDLRIPSEDEYRVCSYYGNQPDIHRLPVLYKEAATAAIKHDRCICSHNKKRCKATEKCPQILGGNQLKCGLVCLESGSDSRLKCGGSDEDTKIISLHREKVKISLNRIKRLPAKKTDRTIRCTHFHPKLFGGMGLCSYIHDQKLALEIYGNDISNFVVPNIASTWYVVPLLNFDEEILKNARMAGHIGTLKNARSTEHIGTLNNARSTEHIGTLKNARTAGNTPHRATKKNRFMKFAAKAIHALTPAKKSNKATKEFIDIHTSNFNEMISGEEQNEHMLKSPSKKCRNTPDEATRPTYYNTPRREFFSHDNDDKILGKKNSENAFEDYEEMQHHLLLPSSSASCSKAVSIGNGFVKDDQTIEVDCNHRSSSISNKLANQELGDPPNKYTSFTTPSTYQKRKKKLPLLKKDLFGDVCHDDKSICSNDTNKKERDNHSACDDPPSTSSSAASFDDHLTDQFKFSLDLDMDDGGMIPASPDANEEIDVEFYDTNVKISLDLDMDDGGMIPASPDANEEIDVEFYDTNEEIDTESSDANKDTELLKAIAVIQKDIIQKKVRDNAEVNGLAVKILELNSDENRPLHPYNGSKFYNLQYKNSPDERSRAGIFCKLSKGRVTTKHNSGGATNKQEKTSAETVQNIIDIIYPGTDKESKTREVLNYIVEEEMNGNILWEGLSLDLDDCLTIRHIGRLSTNNTVRVLDAVGKLLEVRRLFPGRLKLKIGNAEWSDFLSVKLISIEADVGQGKKKNCVFWWNPNVVHLLERLTTSAILDGKFEDSIDVSSLIGKTVFLHGIDRGGPDLVACLRLVNRKDGNSGEYSIPLSCFEDAHETFDNIVNATLSKDRSRIFGLFKEGVHIFHIIVYTKQDIANEQSTHAAARVMDTSSSVSSAPSYAFLNKHRLIFDAESLMLQFKSSSDNDRFSAKELNVRVVTIEELRYIDGVPALKEFYANATHANASDREMPHVIDIDDDHITLTTDSSTGTLNAQFHAYLVVGRDLDIDNAKIQEDGNEVQTTSDHEETNNACEKSIVGIELYTSSDHHLYSFVFASPMKHFDASIYDARIICQRSMLLNADDGKMLTSLTGLGTASATYPCPRCIQRIDCRDLPSWCERYREILGPTFICKDAKPRTGYYSVEECNDRYEKAVGCNGRFSRFSKGKIEKFVIKYCYSVSRPARIDPPQDIHGDALHIHAGILTHLNDEIFLLLQSIKRNKIGGGTTTWYETKLDEALIIVKEMSNILKTDAYKDGMKICRKWNEVLMQKQVSLQTAIESNEPESMIEMKQDELNNVHDIVQNVHKDTGVGIMNLKYKGAEAFLALVGEKAAKGKKGNSESK